MTPAARPAHRVGEKHALPIPDYVLMGRYSNNRPFSGIGLSYTASVSDEPCMDCRRACDSADLRMSCVFSQAPREKNRLRPATLRGSAFSAFRKSFRQEPAKSAEKEKIFRTFRKSAAGPWEQPSLAPLREGVLRDHSGTTKEIKTCKRKRQLSTRLSIPSRKATASRS